jgi:hypothetical protein
VYTVKNGGTFRETCVETQWDDALRSKRVEVDALFFPKDHEHPLDHEYQLLLATDAGRLAFDRSLAFLSAHAR